MLRYSGDAHIGESVSVQLDRGTISAQVRWLREGQMAYISPTRWSSVGVEMNFRMIKARIEEARDLSDRRRTARHPVEIGARVRELGAEGFEAMVLNISETGFAMAGSRR
jgi:hypothetical protein